MTEAQALHVTKGRYQRDEHLLQFLLLPEHLGLLALSEDILKVLTVLDVFTDNTDPVSVVHRLVEEVSVKLNYVRMILSFE